MQRSGTYILACDPIPLARARYAHKRVWDSQKETKLLCSMMLQDQHDDQELFKGPLQIDIVFFFKVPPSFSEKKKLERYGKPHMVKPDLDNLIKFILDIANDILYDDDCTVSSITAQKIYDENPRTVLSITELS